MFAEKKGLFTVLKALGLVLPPVLFYFCFRHVDWTALGRALASFHPLTVVAILAVVSALPLVKALQWKLFASRYARLSLAPLYQTVAVWMMAFNVFPLWAGEALAIYLLNKKNGLPKSVAASVITLDQICEGISLALIFSVLAWASAIPSWMQHSMRIILALIAVAFGALLYFSWRHREPAAEEVPPASLRGRIALHFRKWAHHLEPLRNPRKMLPALLLTLVVRAVEIGTLILLQKSFGLHLPDYSPFLVIAGLHLAMFIPFSPGNLGVFEAAVFFVYRFLGVEPSLALGLALSFHVFTALPLILQGYCFYLRLGLKKRRIDAAADQTARAGNPNYEISPSQII